MSTKQQQQFKWTKYHSQRVAAGHRHEWELYKQLGGRIPPLSAVDDFIRTYDAKHDPTGRLRYGLN